MRINRCVCTRVADAVGCHVRSRCAPLPPSLPPASLLCAGAEAEVEPSSRMRVQVETADAVGQTTWSNAANVLHTCVSEWLSSRRICLICFALFYPQSALFCRLCSRTCFPLALPQRLPLLAHLQQRPLRHRSGHLRLGQRSRLRLRLLLLRHLPRRPPARRRHPRRRRARWCRAVLLWSSAPRRRRMPPCYRAFSPHGVAAWMPTRCA